MEAHFGCDFGGVRLHTDARAACSARALGAAAYTAGVHIVFAQGRYRPGTQAGLWLLAHELAHVVQQGRDGGLPPLGVGADDDPLERAADRAADLFAAGCPLPPGYAFGAAPAGIIQRHIDLPCGGTRVTIAGNIALILAANQRIERAYKADPWNQEHIIIFGSDWDRESPNHDIVLPRNSSNPRWANEYLHRFRGIQNQRRPDVIDFTARKIYEFKTVNFAAAGTTQLDSYYQVTNQILKEIAPHVPPWSRAGGKLWYPDHVLPLGEPDPRLFVCTEATDHTQNPALILYDVRRVRRRRRRKPSQYYVMDYMKEYDGIMPQVKGELPNKIGYYEPESPDYVIVAPKEFFDLEVVKQWDNEGLKKRWDMVRAKIPPTSFIFRDAPAVKFVILSGGLAAAVGLALVSAGALAPAKGAAAGVLAADVVAVEAADAATIVGVEAGSGAALRSTIVVSEEITARLLAAGTTEAAAYQTALAAPTTRAVAALAGTLLVACNHKTAPARYEDQGPDTQDPSGEGTGSHGGPPPVYRPPWSSIDNVTALKIVPVADFEVIGNGAGVAASSNPDPDVFMTAEEAKETGLFFVGMHVLYDNVPHTIIATATVR
jgi:hypothetical protein